MVLYIRASDASDLESTRVPTSVASSLLASPEKPSGCSVALSDAESDVCSESIFGEPLIGVQKYLEAPVSRDSLMCGELVG